jgi:hypothetical protein
MLSSTAMLGPLVLSLLLSKAGADTATSQAETALDALQAWYDEGTGLWDTCGWWNGANCMTMLADLAAVDPTVVSTATAVFSNTYQNAPAQNPAPGVEKVSTASGTHTTYRQGWPNKKAPLHPAQGSDTVDASAWLDGYYDDDGWWALAWIAAYDVTQNQDYLSLAEGIFDDMVSSNLASESSSVAFFVATSAIARKHQFGSNTDHSPVRLEAGRRTVAMGVFGGIPVTPILMLSRTSSSCR